MSEQDSQSDSDSDITDEDEELEEIERSKKKYDMFGYVAMGIPLNKEHREWQSKKSARASKHRTRKAKNQGINTVCGPLKSERSNTKLVDSLPLAFLNLI